MRQATGVVEQLVLQGPAFETLQDHALEGGLRVDHVPLTPAQVDSSIFGMNILLPLAFFGSGIIAIAATWQARAHFWQPLQSSMSTCGTSVEDTIALGYPCLLIPSRIPQQQPQQ